MNKVYSLTLWNNKGEDKLIILKRATKDLKQWEKDKGFIIVQSLISGLTAKVNKISLKEIGVLK